MPGLSLAASPDPGERSFAIAQDDMAGCGRETSLSANDRRWSPQADTSAVRQ
ncbi:MAG TPA: hypothetical protein VKB35_14220 [Ktedonobacteraceae bacterium]|nr:hypothetical protein [Ktedonobacteraceae bacterium]